MPRQTCFHPLLAFCIPPRSRARQKKKKVGVQAIPSSRWSPGCNASSSRTPLILHFSPTRRFRGALSFGSLLPSSPRQALRGLGGLPSLARAGPSPAFLHSQVQGIAFPSPKTNPPLQQEGAWRRGGSCAQHPYFVQEETGVGCLGETSPERAARTEAPRRGTPKCGVPHPHTGAKSPQKGGSRQTLRAQIGDAATMGWGGVGKVG